MGITITYGSDSPQTQEKYQDYAELRAKRDLYDAPEKLENYNSPQTVSSVGKAQSQANDEVPPLKEEIVVGEPIKGTPVYNLPINFGYDFMRRIYGIVIHGFEGNINSIIHALRQPSQGEWYGLAYHFLIYGGAIWKLTPEGVVTYHAGPSQFPDIVNGLTSGINEVTIGIAILNKDATDADYLALTNLIKDIMLRQPYLRKKLIYCHKEVSPGRKTDPEVFDREKFDMLMDWDNFTIERNIALIRADIKLAKNLGRWDQALNPEWKPAKELIKEDAIKAGVYDLMKADFEN